MDKNWRLQHEPLVNVFLFRGESLLVIKRIFIYPLKTSCPKRSIRHFRCTIRMSIKAFCVIGKYTTFKSSGLGGGLKCTYFIVEFSTIGYKVGNLCTWEGSLSNCNFWGARGSSFRAWLKWLCVNIIIFTCYFYCFTTINLHYGLLWVFKNV